MKTYTDVLTYLQSIPQDATEARKWQAVRTASRRLMKTHGVADAAKWKIEALPSQAHTRYGDCNFHRRRIRYRTDHVKGWWTTTLTSTIVHEVAHAITAAEMVRQGRRGTGGHGPMWKGTAAALGLTGAQAHNLPRPTIEILKSTLAGAV